jgi:hypothetical protein
MSASPRRPDLRAAAAARSPLRRILSALATSLLVREHGGGHAEAIYPPKLGVRQAVGFCNTVCEVISSILIVVLDRVNEIATLLLGFYFAPHVIPLRCVAAHIDNLIANHVGRCSSATGQKAHQQQSPQERIWSLHPLVSVDCADHAIDRAKAMKLKAGPFGLCVSQDGERLAMLVDGPPARGRNPGWRAVFTAVLPHNPYRLSSTRWALI